MKMTTRSWIGLGTLIAILGVSSLKAEVAVSQVPLYLGGQVDPNIMFVIDDSGSMYFEATPDDLAFPGSQYAGFVFPRADDVYGSHDYAQSFIMVSTVDADNPYTAITRSPQHNTGYYNPGVTYRPWIRHDNTYYPDANPVCAWHNPEKTGSCPADSVNSVARNLTVSNGRYNDNYWRSCDSAGTCSSSTAEKSFWPATYYWDNGGNEWAWANYTQVEIRSTTTEYVGHGRENRADCADAANSRCTYAEEIQNFANWYTYYRSRILASRAGIGFAFAEQSDAMRVGYGAINKAASTVDGVSTHTIVDGVRKFDAAGREAFFDELYTRDLPGGGTPLRRALDAAGQYYSRSDSSGPWSTTPGVSGGDDLTCRQSYTILMTDGYWSGGTANDADTSAARENVDNSSGTVITSPSGDSYQYEPADPYRDELDDTLADIAMYYWKRDLRTDLDNKVPLSASNEAFWQHMVTFGVGLGVTGSVDPDDAWAAVASQTAIAWPDPGTGTNCSGAECPARLDDLLHAGINSRGGFFSAQDPITFSNQLSGLLNEIIARTESSAAAIATNSTRLDADTLVFQARFDSRDWRGELRAYEVDEADGSVSETHVWEASEKLDLVPHGSRNIFTYNPSVVGDRKGVEFVFDELSADQKTDVGSIAVVNFLRGDRTGEGSTFRNRGSALGDIVNSDPWFVGRANFGYSVLEGNSGNEGADYVDFISDPLVAGRQPAIYVGANDGMLHAFRGHGPKSCISIVGGVEVTDASCLASAGAEMFSYVPNAVYENLASLSEPTYEHKYFVDGAPRAGDAYIDLGDGAGKQWRTVLVGSVGAGGRGVFALDVTDPENFNESNVLWEFGYAAGVACTTGVKACQDVGESIGQPSLVRLVDERWGVIFGNGYNSDSDQSSLFIVDAATGALIRHITTSSGSAADPNGMSTPVVADINGDRIADRVYVGDLHGNLWRLDISDTNLSKWESKFKSGSTPAPLFKAVDSQATPVRQPITAKPQVGNIKDGTIMLYFGTGSYFKTGDPLDLQIQSFYGIQDKDTTVNRTDLLVQTIDHEFHETFTNPVTSEDYDWDVRVVSNNAIADTNKGWLLDLIPPHDVPEGERVVTVPLIWRDRVIFTTVIPDADPCSFGGTSWLMELDPATGGRLNFSVFDLNKDNLFDEGEYVVIDGVPVPVSGIRSKEGIIKTPGVVSADGVVYKYTSGSSGKIEVIENAGEAGRGRQSWTQLR